MPTYQYLCEGCEIIWEKDADIGKAPKTTKCKECGKRVERYLSEITFSFKDDGVGCGTNPGAKDFYTIRKRYRTFLEKGYDKTAANKFLNRSINETKDRISEDRLAYKQVKIDVKQMAQDGHAKKLTQQQTDNKKRNLEKMAAHAYDKAKLDPKRKIKQVL